MRIRLCELSHLLSFILVDIVALINKFTEELLTAAVTDIRILTTGGACRDVQRTRDAENAGQAEKHGVLDILHLCRQTGTFQPRKPTGESNFYLTGEVLGDELFLGNLVRTPGMHVLRLRTLRYTTIALDANKQTGMSLVSLLDLELAHINDRGDAIHSRLSVFFHPALNLFDRFRVYIVETLLICNRQ